MLELLELFELLGVSHRAEHRPSELSGGEQQRIAVARSLINRPKVIFADEPSGNLDSKNAQLVFDIFNQLTKEFNTSLLIVTHDPDFALKTDRIIEMADGEIVRK